MIADRIEGASAPEALDFQVLLGRSLPPFL
jgi:hypothetical protein